jgi:predicted alpha/beta-fold hydrolase
MFTTLILTMKIFFNDPLFDAQLVRTMNHVYHNGADVGECMTTAYRIKDKDTDSWYKEWTATADRLYKEAEQSEASGHLTSAGEAYLKASNYYRTSYIFLIGSPQDIRVRTAYQKQKDCFRKALKGMNIPSEIISIPYENTNLPGYFLRAYHSDTPRPTLIITGGYDCTSEELYFFSAAAALRRGYNCLIFDGPGQGGALIEQRMHFRSDWENVITPVVNYLCSRNDIQKEQVALMGISFGGYLAPRAVTKEHRISALIADPAQLDMYEAVKVRMPGFLLNYMESKSSFKNRIANKIIRSVLKDPVKGWSLRRGMAVHGVSSVQEYVQLMKEYTIKGKTDSIRCATLVCDAENDEIAAFAKTVYDLLKCPKKYIRFKNEEGAGEHCEDGNRSLFNQRVFDWLDEQYKHELVLK